MITEGYEAGFAAASQQQPAGMRWVKASERLPGYDIPVLWISKDGNQFVEMLDKDGNDWLYNLELSDESATHWMPLPAPPSESSPAGAAEGASEGMAEALRKVQIGESAEADFDRNLWSFEMPDNYSVNSGSFAIVPLELYKQFLASLLPASDEG